MLLAGFAHAKIRLCIETILTWVWKMKNLCDGSRRPVRGERHELKTTTETRHAKATCPVCKRELRVVRVQGVLEFPRHPALEK